MFKINLNKKTIFFILIIAVLGVLSIFYAKAFLQTNPEEVIPPDSFIKEGEVLTLIEEDEKYYIKTENFSATGEYNTPAMEKQIAYDEYAQIRSNGEFDILEKRNRHIINDVYVDEYYKAYVDGEVMAGNYVAEVLDGYFIPVQFDEFQSVHRVLINDGGIYYLATFHYDKDYNYTSAASYLLLSENQYNEYIVNENYDYIKDVTWEISYDGNTIVKTICYYDKNNELIMRPIVSQMTGFDDLEEYINPDDIEDAPETTVTPTPDDTDDTDTPDGGKDNGKDDTKPGKDTTGSDKGGTSGTTPWTGTVIEFPDGVPFVNWSAEWSDMGNTADSEGGSSDSATNTVEGYYDDAGNFIEIDESGNVVPSEEGTFDENSNFIPSGEEGYYDADGVWHPADTGEGSYDEDGNFVVDGETIDKDGNIIDEETPTDVPGSYDEDGNFVQEDGTIIDGEGVIHTDASDIELLDSNGNKIMKAEGFLTLDFYGRVVLFGKEGYYDEHGLIHLPDGKVGYYNADGRFFESRQNEYSNQGGFYDVSGDFHLFNTIYTTENGSTHLILYPELGLTTDGLTITVPGSSYQYSSTGLVTNGNKKGYFNEVGEFIKSDKSAFKGGFYTEKGSWIDDSLYKVNIKNEIELTYGYFDSFGLYITPNNDRGYFNEAGTFIINKENPYKDNYYKWDGKKQAFGEIYIDDLGNIHRTGSDEVITSTGQITTSKTRKGVLDKNGNWFNIGITITPAGEIGHYNEFAEFKLGQVPYLYGYYDANGYFYRYDGIIISPDGKVGYYDADGNWVEGVQGATLDANGNWVLPDGTVITPDGKVGYYDADGQFHEGENPNTEMILDAGASLDKNGNIISADGTVTLADGTVGYYDENGNFVAGVNPNKEGYYDANGEFHSYAEEGIVDEEGNVLLVDGTVISKDGEKGYYDENGNFVEGENPNEESFYDANGNLITSDDLTSNTTLINKETLMADGTVIAADGTVGHYDEKGNFVEGENTSTEGYYDENGEFHSFAEEGTLDSNGNIVLEDGTVISKDGVKGYYDENGVFHEGENPYKGGYYDENGNWISENATTEGVIDANGNIIMPDGTVITPDGKIGYYDENGNFIEGVNPNKEGYYDADGKFHSYAEEGTLDANGNIVLEDGTVIGKDGVKGYYDENGVFHEGENPYKGGYYDANGNWVSDSAVAEGVVDANGNIVMADGTVISKDGTIGYYDENGNFVAGVNPNKEGYYDANGKFHSYAEEGTLDANGNIVLEDGTVISKDGVKGYYDENGVFHEGENPYVGGHYDENGNWIPDTVSEGTLDANGNIVIADGTVISKDGTVGYYDENGNFVAGVNPNKEGYYDADGKFHSYTEEGTLDANGNIVLEDGTVISKDGTKGYYDENGVFHEGENPYKGGYYDENGNWVSDAAAVNSIEGTIDANGNIVMADGTVISKDGTVGYYDENGNFVAGVNPNKEGYYDADGKFHSYAEKGTLDANGNIVLKDGTVISKDGTKGYYDENGEFHEGENPNKGGYYDANGNWVSENAVTEGTIDVKGNIVMTDGTVISKDGKVGYYDENGNFVAGVNSNKEGYYDADGKFHSYAEEGTTDSKGNIVLEDGTVISKDGTKGYYDKNGVFHEGENPSKGGYYDANGNWVSDTAVAVNGGKLDSNGNTILADGTVVNADGTVGYYDKKGKFIEGVNPSAEGYYDANGKFHSYAEEGTLDANGNIVLKDGTVISKDGVKGYYDANGNFVKGINPNTEGYYDANGNWVASSKSEQQKIEGYYDSNGNWVATTNAGYKDSNGNTVLPNGVVTTADGKVGYYDENGKFHEGTNPNTNGYYDEKGVWHDGSELPEHAAYDGKGNLVMEDGTVITTSGEVGYYDKNGKFHEGTNPYTGGYYNENGEWQANGSYDSEGNYVMSDGTIVTKNGEVILPDGTTVKGYIDENGKLVISENLSGNSYYDEQGNLIQGENPDKNGHYDAEGNYYINGDKGFYDEAGNYHSEDGTVGYYDENGKFVEGTNPYINGFYDENGEWHGSSTIDNVSGYYDENGVFHQGENPYTGGYYDKNGEWHDSSSLGTVDKNGNVIMPNGAVIKDGKSGYYDENGVFHQGTNPYTDGYYDADGKWHSYDEITAESYVDSKGNTVFSNGIVTTADGKVGYYDESGKFVEGESPYTGGYYDADGKWHESTGENGAYFDADGNLVMSDGTIIDKNGNVVGTMGTISSETEEALVSYYDENGNIVYGTENPYEGGYYDSQGNWHSDSENVVIDSEGNAHLQDGGIGYYDAEGNFHLNKDAGYYDTKGTYHAEDGSIGYYDKDGVYHKGEENPYSGGYYDAKGNWHPEGELGYYDKDGVWHENVSNTVVGYYDENGVFHEGTNPYTNGYYDENGEWHGDGAPKKTYYDAEGNLIEGESPYKNGYYDKNGNWHPTDSDGYYDSNGTYHKKDGSKGYYDSDGIFHEGTNPYIGGYYDANGNWHPVGKSGYYDVNGTYYEIDGSYGYYDVDGNWIPNQQNPNTDGYYDAEGNWHPFGAEGYYDVDGVWHDLVSINEKYKYGSKDYILFTGTWRTSTENKALRLAGNTVQFTVDKTSINKTYIDTGIYVALNSILEYEEAKDILHSLAITTNNVFIQDFDSCMIVYNGRIISLNKQEKVTVKTLKEFFKNTNIDITVAKTRIGKKYVLVEAIETSQNIKLKFDDTIVTPKYPLTVIDNEAYVALSDVSDIISYNYAMKPSGKNREITFTLKNTIPYEDLRQYFSKKIVMTTEDGTVNYSSLNNKTKVEVFKTVKPTLITMEDGSQTTYIPIKIIPRLTGCDASFDTSKYIIDFNYSEGISFMKDYYDNSNNLDGNEDIEFNETKSNNVE